MVQDSKANMMYSYFAYGGSSHILFVQSVYLDLVQPMSYVDVLCSSHVIWSFLFVMLRGSKSINLD